MPTPDLFRLNLPNSEQLPAADTEPVADAAPESGAVVRFPGTEVLPADPGQPAALERIQSAAGVSVERFAAGWRAAWIGDGVLGMRPRPVADLARQFWTAPPPYIQDALILRIPYALYGVVAVPLSAAAHLLLLIISYPSLLAAALTLALFIHLFL
ncbi:hypothetical protein ACLQ2R_17110 [Streptosporangium sp. DT93]|uniref:hypothetical protein n=1 Tax=Streptosporangium sp. DT93 TaxID=3393428 RepID=UPI003CE78616